MAEIPDIPGVSIIGDKGFKIEISGDDLGSNLENALNSPEECIDIPMDNLNNKIQNKCNLHEKLLDANSKLAGLETYLQDALPGVEEDIDLLYDPKLDEFRFKLFNNEKLTLDINLTSEQIQPLGEMIVAIINNMSFEHGLPELKKDGKYFSEINIDSNSYIATGLYYIGSLDDNPNSYINSDTMNDIFHYSSEFGSTEKQATKQVQKLHSFMQKCFNYLIERKKAGVNIEIK